MSRLSHSPDYEWLQKAMLAEEVQDEMALTWSCHYLEQKRKNEFPVSITALLPHLKEQSHYVATIQHAIDKIKGTTGFLILDGYRL